MPGVLGTAAQKTAKKCGLPVEFPAKIDYNNKIAVYAPTAQERMQNAMKTTAMTAEERVRYMTQAPVRRLILEMSLPTVISMLVSSFYNMVDTIFVGQLDTQSTAAVGVAYSAMALLQAISFFFGHGSGNYISRQLGARNYDSAERMAATGFFSALFTGCVIAVAGIAFVTPISRVLGSTETILPYTVAYLRIIFLGAPFLIGSFVLNNQMRFQGSASISMVGIMAGAVLNVVLDPVLIFGFHMGIAGAAWATSISQFVSFVVLLVLNRRRAAIKVKLRCFTPQAHYFYKIFTGGVPSLCRQGVGSLGAILLNIAAGSYGGAAADAAIAAMGVVNRISMFANSALIGFGQGFQPVCGTNYGAGKHSRVRQAFYFCIRLGGCTVAVLSVLGFAFAPQLIRLFRDDAQVVAIGTTALRAQCLTLVLTVWIILCTMLLQTIGMAWQASVTAAARQGLFLIPVVFILPHFLGLTGVEIAQPAADVLSFALALPMGLSVLKTFRSDAPAQQPAHVEK